VNEGKVNLTSSELVVKINETEYECMISSNADVIDRMKIQKIKYVPKNFGICMSRRVARAEGKRPGHLCNPRMQ